VNAETYGTNDVPIFFFDAFTFQIYMHCVRFVLLFDTDYIICMIFTNREAETKLHGNGRY
jgi:hypothetical protein